MVVLLYAEEFTEHWNLSFVLKLAVKLLAGLDSLMKTVFTVRFSLHSYIGTWLV